MSIVVLILHGKKMSNLSKERFIDLKHELGIFFYLDSYEVIL